MTPRRVRRPATHGQDVGYRGFGDHAAFDDFAFVVEPGDEVQLGVARAALYVVAFELQPIDQ